MFVLSCKVNPKSDGDSAVNLLLHSSPARMIRLAPFHSSSVGEVERRQVSDDGSDQEAKDVRVTCFLFLFCLWNSITYALRLITRKKTTDSLVSSSPDLWVAEA